MGDGHASDRRTHQEMEQVSHWQDEARRIQEHWAAVDTEEMNLGFEVLLNRIRRASAERSARQTEPLPFEDRRHDLYGTVSSMQRTLNQTLDRSGRNAAAARDLAEFDPGEQRFLRTAFRQMVEVDGTLTEENYRAILGALKTTWGPEYASAGDLRVILRPQ